MSEPVDLILKGVRIASPTGVYEADVTVKDGRFHQIGYLSGIEASETVDAKGLHLFPGVIDTQVHFREPGFEHKEDLESGTRAAILGGVTTIFEMPNTNPTTTTPAALADKVSRAQGRAWTDFGFFFGASTDNLASLEAAETLPGSPGIKLFAGSSTGSLLVEAEEGIRKVLKNGHRPVAVHSEDEARLRQRKAEIEPKGPEDHPTIRDAEAARISTERLIRLCAETGRPVHILHISTKDEIPLLREAKRQGLPVTCEITPQHLTFSSEDYRELGTKLQMNPPVRSEEHREALWWALREGLFDVFGSDHAPHTLDEKGKPYPESPSGMPGVQTLFPVMLDRAVRGEIALAAVVRMTSQAPAKLFGIKGKGLVAPGYDADFCLVDLGSSWEVRAEDLASKAGWSPFEGAMLRGRVQSTFLRGRKTTEDGATIGTPTGQPASYTWK